jgi:hypothetical protein
MEKSTCCHSAIISCEGLEGVALAPLRQKERVLAFDQTLVGFTRNTSGITVHTAWPVLYCTIMPMFRYGDSKVPRAGGRMRKAPQSNRGLLPLLSGAEPDQKRRDKERNTATCSAPLQHTTGRMGPQLLSMRSLWLISNLLVLHSTPTSPLPFLSLF